MKAANRATLTGGPVLFLMGLSATAPFSCGGGVKFHRRHTLSIQVKSVAVKLSEKQLSKAVLWQSPFPLTLCLTYFIMPTIMFLRIICQVIGGACGGILVPCSDRWRMVMHPYRTLLPTVTG